MVEPNAWHPAGTRLQLHQLASHHSHDGEKHNAADDAYPA